MIKILLVDDDEPRAQEISSAMEQAANRHGEDVSVVKAASASQALSVLEVDVFDLLVLDVVLPIRDGDQLRRDGGLIVLRQLSVMKRGHIPAYIAGITEHEDVIADAESEFGDGLWQIIRYRVAENRWMRQLERLVEHICRAKRLREDRTYRKDLGIVTALQWPELTKVLELKADWKKCDTPGDSTIYYEGVLRGHDREVSVVAASACQMGMPAATACAMKIIDAFRPRYLGMVGIAAGVSGQHGDLLIADQTWDYGSGKILQDSDGGLDFQPAPDPIPVGADLRARLHLFRERKGVLAQIRENWTEAAPDGLNAEIGGIASGAAVLQAESILKGIRRHNRKLIGVEMEAYGLMVAARMCTEPRPEAFIVKSIADFGDGMKNDVFQPYAAYTSAQFVAEFALEFLGRIATRTRS